MPPSEHLISSLHRDSINCTNTVSIKTSCLALQNRKQELEYRINEIMKITLAVFKFNLKCHFQTGNEMTTSAFALELWVWRIMPPFPVSQNQMAAPLYWGIFKPSENKQTKPLYTSPDGLWALHTHTSPGCRTETLFLNAPCDNEGPHMLKLRAVFTTPGSNPDAVSSAYDNTGHFSFPFSEIWAEWKRCQGCLPKSLQLIKEIIGSDGGPQEHNLIGKCQLLIEGFDFREPIPADFQSSEKSTDQQATLEETHRWVQLASTGNVTQQNKIFHNLSAMRVKVSCKLTLMKQSLKCLKYPERLLQQTVTKDTGCFTECHPLLPLSNFLPICCPALSNGTCYPVCYGKT